jgi:hypothetical protein
MAGMAVREDPGWIRWPVATLATTAAGWMVFDGSRALLVGDYVTMDGRLGPWAELVSALGIEPRGTGMKTFFVAYGLCWLTALASYLRHPTVGRPALAVAAVASSWYLVIGTVSSVIQLGLLAASKWARERAAAGVRPPSRPETT